jgi:hypothetical protein
VDLWESEADFGAPATPSFCSMEKVMSERGVTLDGPPPEPVIVEAFDVVLGH